MNASSSALSASAAAFGLAAAAPAETASAPVLELLHAAATVSSIVAAAAYVAINFLF